MAPNNSSASRRLLTELKQLSTPSSSSSSMFSASPIDPADIFHWQALIAGPDDTPFASGVFRAVLHFPPDYPLMPFKMKFDPPVFHPNFYKDGNVCISILHNPGEDPSGYELSSERWSPVQSVEKVLLSVISLLAEPNTDSPADVDCAKLYRVDRKAFEARVKSDILKSLEITI